MVDTASGVSRVSLLLPALCAQVTAVDAGTCTYTVTVAGSREVLTGVSREELRRPLTRGTTVLCKDASTWYVPWAEQPL